MKKFGIILSAYGNQPYLSECLNPWRDRFEKNGDVIVACSSIRFKNFEPCDNQQVIETLNSNKFVHQFLSDLDMYEHEARNLCLNFLKESACDYYWLMGSDEIYTEKQIDDIINFVNKDEDSCWFSINFKNYVFDGKGWIDGFCPPRIFKNSFYSYKINEMYWDDDFSYISNGFTVDYKSLSNLAIPKHIAHVKHMTWLHENGRAKVEYQKRHFGNCSYVWNYEKNKLEFAPGFSQEINIDNAN